ncbi:MAG: imidazole glycerol phosphate synthase subunit HisH [Chloroflexota bacterium]|nr:imidazole glycerol phosphate synthase subunit HisH [Chloroflexota bacterium]
MTIAIVDYGAGNLKSVTHAAEHVGLQPLVTDDPAVIAAAAGVILPGVGAAADTMLNLERRHLVATVRDVITRGTPFFGVCMGLQALFTLSQEGGAHRCLDVLPGTVRRFPAGLSIPHMGWNQVRQARPHPFFDGIPDGANFYFVHSYHADPADPGVVAGVTDYGIDFPSVVIRDNVVATQFHPEKSGPNGLRLYANFGRIVQAAIVQGTHGHGRVAVTAP